MKTLYSTPLPEQAQHSEQKTIGKQLAKQGLLNESETSVTPISARAADVTLTGQFRWGERVSTMLAAELAELSDSNLSTLPLYRLNKEFGSAGYYEVESTSADPLHPNRRDVWEYTLTLAYAGNRANRRRSLKTKVSQVDHPFGNDDRALAGVPATARKVRWYNSETQATAEPTVVTTRGAELGDVRLYDIRSAPYDDPALVYDIDYDDEGPTDISCWDDRGYDARSDSNDIRQWRKATSPEHEFDGQIVLSNGLVRLFVDERNQALAAEHWDDANATWSSQSLGTSDWELFDADVRGIGMTQVRARMEFRDPTQSPTAYDTLDCYLARGYKDPLWAETGDPMPTGLADLLDPVASGLIYEPGATKGLVDRQEVL